MAGIILHHNKSLQSGLFSTLFLGLLICLFLLGSVAFYLFKEIPFCRYGIDDANIFFVYASNIADGFGFVYNAGGERVEGASSLLWLLMLVPLFKGFANPEIYSIALTVVLLSFSLALLNCYFLRSSCTDGVTNKKILSMWTVILLCWLLVTPAYVIWSALSMMETGVWSALLICIWITVTKTFDAKSALPVSVAFMVLNTLVVLVRPEGIFLAAGFYGLFVGMLFLSESERTYKQRIAWSVGAGSSLVFSVAVLFLFRSAYFGFIFPNTYYAKVSYGLTQRLDHGWEYFLSFIRWQPLLWVALIFIGLSLVLFPVVYFIKGLKCRAIILPDLAGAFVASCFIIAGLAFPVFSGGDHFGSFRFYQPFWPLFVIPFILVMRIVLLFWGNTKRGFVLRLAFCMMVSFLLLIVGVNVAEAKWSDLKTTKLPREYSVAYSGRRLGASVKDFFNPLQPSMGAIAAGGVKLTYPGEVIDLLGLNNVAMAHADQEKIGIKNHAAFNKTVFYHQQPDLLPLQFVPQTTQTFIWEGGTIQKHVNSKWTLIPLKGLYHDKNFHERYSLVSITRESPKDEETFITFANKAFLEQYLKENPKFSFQTVETGHIQFN